MAMFRQRPTVPVLLFVLLIFGVLHLSLAASGGVMGGSASSDSSSSSSDDDCASHHSYDPFSYSGFSRTRLRTDYSDGTDDISGSEWSPRGFETSDLVFLLVGSATVVIWASYIYLCYRADMNNSVLMIQVGLAGVAQSVQKELNRTAKHCDTTTALGLNHILKVSSDILLRNINHCVSTYSFVNQKLSGSSMSKLIDQLSKDERAQFDVETLVNINGIKLYRPLTTIADGSANTDFIVVTILVAAEGSHDLPVMDDRESLRKTLACLRSIGISETKKVFVLWTPQKKEDRLSEDEVIQKYPYLRPLRKYAVD